MIINHPVKYQRLQINQQAGCGHRTDAFNGNESLGFFGIQLMHALMDGFIELLDLGTTGQLWMKVSAIYRLAGDARQNLEFACSVLPLLEQSLGSKRLVWGSDWPHTQHEQDVDYGGVMEQLRALGCSERLRQAMLIDSPAQLFRFVLPENT